MYKGVTPSCDPQFMRKLKAYDSKLYFEFDREVGRFVIRRKVECGTDPKFWYVQTEDGEFRQPDDRDLAAVALADLWTGDALRQRVEQGEDLMRGYKDKREKELEQEVRDATKDDKYQLRSAFRKACNDGKALPPFRQVIPKNKGKTAAQIMKSALNAK